MTKKIVEEGTPEISGVFLNPETSVSANEKIIMSAGFFPEYEGVVYNRLTITQEVAKILCEVPEYKIYFAKI